MAERSFVGREQELQRLHAFLRDDSRWLLRVTGLGGIGKSVFLSAIKRKYHSSTIVVAPLTLAGLVQVHRSNTREQRFIDFLCLFLQLASEIHDQCDAQTWRAFDTFCNDTRRNLMRQLHTSIESKQHLSFGDNSSAEGITQVMTITDDPRMQELLHQAHELVFEELCRLMETFTPTELIITIDACEWFDELTDRAVELAKIQRVLFGIHHHLERRGKRCSVILASDSDLFLSAIVAEEQQELRLSSLDRAAVHRQLEHAGIQDPEMRECLGKITCGIAACVSLVCELWQNLPDDEKPRSITDLPVLQRKFYHVAMEKFITRHVLKRRLAFPYDRFSYYGALLHCFTRPILEGIFPDVFDSSDEMQAREYFDRFVRFPYIKPLGERRYKLFELLRAVLAEDIRDKDPDAWRSYHKRAVEILSTLRDMPSPITLAAEWHYHTLAYKLAQSEAEAVAYWKKMLLETAVSRESHDALMEAVHDETLLLTEVARVAQAYEQEQSRASREVNDGRASLCR